MVYLRPRSLFSAGFMGEVNRIPLTDGLSPLGPLMPGTGTLLLRPEAIGAEGEIDLGPARLEDIAFFGTHQRAHFVPLAAPDLRLVVHLPQSAMPSVGQVMALRADKGVVL